MEPPGTVSVQEVALRETAPRRLGGVVLGGAILLAAASFFLARYQWATPHLVDRDAYYHARYAERLPDRGLARDFPWTQESMWRDRFADKELLYHVLLVPFCRSDATLVPGLKLATFILGVLVFLAFYAVLVAARVRAPTFFALLLLFAGNHVLFRMVMGRAHLLSVGIAVVGAGLILARRYRLLYPLAFAYAWTYAAPHLLVGLALPDAVARRAREGRWTLGGAGAAALGVVAGLVLNPYVPNSLLLFWVQNVVVLGHAWGVGGETASASPRLGAEFDPVSTRALGESSQAVLLSLLFAVGAAVLGRERPGPRTASLFVMTGFAFVLYLLSAKFIEYLAPLAVLLAASAATDLAAGRRFGDILGKSRAWRTLAIAALLALPVGLGLATEARTLASIRSLPPPSLEGAGRWLRANEPPGRTIAHLSFHDFAVLFHFDPDHRYLVGLDPTFAWVRDRFRAVYLEEVRKGDRPIDGPTLARLFGATALVVSKERPRHVAAAEEAGLELLFEDEGGAVFRLPPADGP